MEERPEKLLLLFQNFLNHRSAASTKLMNRFVRTAVPQLSAVWKFLITSPSVLANRCESMKILRLRAVEYCTVFYGIELIYRVMNQVHYPISSDISVNINARRHNASWLPRLFPVSYSIALTLWLIDSEARNEEYFLGYFQISDMIHVTFRLIDASSRSYQDFDAHSQISGRIALTFRIIDQ